MTVDGVGAREAGGAPGPGAEGVRLQKLLARAGVASRRASEALIEAGRVKVNGRVVTELGVRVDPARDAVEVDGSPVAPPRADAYLALNKPAGFVTTMDDPQGRDTVASLVPLERYPGLFPVGRLDLDTTGILLFMTDGDLGARLLHPSSHVVKVYHALVEGPLDDRDLDPLREGVLLDDGPCAPAACRVMGDREAREAHGWRPAPWQGAVEVKIHEGRKRQVRRMLSEVGHRVVRLERVSFGPILLGGLAEGSWRLLTSAEVAELRAAAGKGASADDRRD